MAYETGVASGVLDLLSKISAFAAGEGWTIDRSTSTELALHHADAGFFSLVADATVQDIGTTQYPKPSITTYGATGFNGGATPQTQPGSSNSVKGETNGLRGPFTGYHLFATTQYIHCVIEIVPDEYAHFHIGKLDKPGPYSGGEYITATNWYYFLNFSSNHHQALSQSHAIPFDNATVLTAAGGVRVDDSNHLVEWGAFSRLSTSTSVSYARGSGRAKYDSSVTPLAKYWSATPNQVNGITPFQPGLVTFTMRNEKSYILGAPADLRIVNMNNLLPGASVTIGSDVWLCFPIKRRGVSEVGQVGQVNSWNFGLAYRKVV